MSLGIIHLISTVTYLYASVVLVLVITYLHYWYLPQNSSGQALLVIAVAMEAVVSQEEALICGYF